MKYTPVLSQYHVCFNQTKSSARSQAGGVCQEGVNVSAFSATGATASWEKSFGSMLEK